MDAFQGAVLGVKLRYLEAWTEARRRLAARYNRALSGLPLELPSEATDRRHVWHLYVALHPERDRIRAALEARGVQTGLHYPVPVHLQEAYAALGYQEGDFPESERVARRVLHAAALPRDDGPAAGPGGRGALRDRSRGAALMSQSLEGATVLVTGGAGLIGSHVVDRLTDEGAGEIRVLDNLVRGRPENLAPARARRAIRFIEGDVRDRAVVRQAVAGCDYVFHQAAIRITLCAERPASAWTSWSRGRST